MVNIGKVDPHFVPAGNLPGRIGRYNLAPKPTTNIPLGIVNYFPQGTYAGFSWRQIRETREINVSDDSVIELNAGLLHATAQARGTLLVRKEQVAPVLFDFWRHVSPSPLNLNEYSWLVLLSYLDKDGQSALSFDLTMTGAPAREIQSFTAGLAIPELKILFEQRDKSGKPLVAFFNPYFQAS